MIRHRLFTESFILLALAGVLNFTASKFYFYYTTNWFDSIVHFVAGGCVAITTLLCYDFFWQKLEIFSLRKIIWIGMFGAFAIGLLWEGYELYFGITNLADGIHYFTDTGSDILMDLLGGFLASLYTVNKISTKNG